MHESLGMASPPRSALLLSLGWVLVVGCYDREAYEGVPVFTGELASAASAEDASVAEAPDASAITDAGTSTAIPGDALCEGEVACVDGDADGHACSGIHLLAHLDGPSMQGGTGNDIWGWTDPQSGTEYVLMGLTNGTAFVDISDPCNPVHLGHLRTETVDATWRDLKVYKDHAFIVSESQAHGMQVFDLARLRDITDPPQKLEADLVVDSFGAAHNLALNEDTGFAYATTTNNCASVRTLDLSDPKNPVDLGCWNTSKRVHDAQCVTYQGPDENFTGKEICIAGNEFFGFGIYDVSDKQRVREIGALRYSTALYGHQGWLTEDHRYLLFGDEQDEQILMHNTKIYIFDLANLRQPQLLGEWEGETTAIDHNLFIVGDYAFVAGYTSGLRILDISGVADAQLEEVAYFDTYPDHDSPNFNGMWGNYPYFGSGVVVTSGSEGLFVLRPDPKFLDTSR